MTTPLFAQTLVDGLARGSLYALLALGFAIPYQATETFNLALGGLVAAAAFLAVAATAMLPFAFAYAAALAVAASVVIGLAIPPLLVRPLSARSPQAVTLGLIGLAMALGAGLDMGFGRDVLTLPTYFTGAVDLGHGLSAPQSQLWETAGCWACIGAVGLILRFTPLGLMLRSGPEGRHVAREAGVDVAAMQRLAFAIGGLCAGVGGLTLAQSQGASTDLESLALMAIPAAAIGGLHSLSGAIVGGLIVGLIQSFAAGHGLPHSGEFAVYLALLALLMLRPRGLVSPREWGVR